MASIAGNSSAPLVTTKDSSSGVTPANNPST